VSLGQIRNVDYAILLCNKMAETRAFYRDIMKFPWRPISSAGSAFALVRRC